MQICGRNPLSSLVLTDPVFCLPSLFFCLCTDYFKNIWSVINFKEAEERFKAAQTDAKAHV